MFNPLTVVNDINRFRQIINVLIKHGFGQLIEQLDISDTYIGKFIVKYKDKKTPTSLGERIKLVCQELGPTFIKLGQILSTRTDILPTSITDELKTLVDKVPPFDYSLVEEQIQRELGDSIKNIFPFFSPYPFASASIAQVHKAVLPSGEKVVVKVQRPDIEKIIETDLDILYIIANLIEKNVPETRILSPVGIISEFDKAIKKETDFRVEARNLLKFAKNFKDNPNIKIPKVFKEYSSKRILTMEYIEGVKITEAEKVGADKKILVKIALKAILKMVYIDGFFHADPHPGNIFALEGNKIAVLDFGQIGKLNEEMRNKMADIVIAVNLRDIESVAKNLFNLGIKETKVNYSEFKADVEEIMENIMGLPLQEISFTKIIEQLFEGAKKHNIRIPHNYTLMAKSLMTIEQVGKELYPELDLEAEARPFVEQLLKERWNVKNVSKNIYKELIDFYELFKQFPSKINNILEDIENGKLKISLQDIDKEKTLRLWDKISKRIAVSLIISALLLSSSIFLVFGSDIEIYGLSIKFSLGFLGYILSLILAVFILLSILK